MTKSSQLALINGNSLTETDVLDAVDVVLGNLYKNNDISKPTEVLNTLDKIGEVAGKAKARLLFGIHKWWIQYGDGDFSDYIRTQTGTSTVTADRYITVQTYIESGEIPEDVAVRPLRELVPIAKTLAHGHTITRKQFDRIVKANSQNEIQDILRNVKNKSPRKSSLQIYLEKDGTISGWINDKKKFCGFLNVQDALVDSDIEKMINRIVDNSGIIRK